MAVNKKLTYQEAITELDNIVRDIESENVDVDHLTRQVARAKFLITYCKGRLRQTEDEVKKVLSEIETQTSEPEPEQVKESAEEGLF